MGLSKSGNNYLVKNKVYNTCVKYNLFTDGSGYQYDKLFEYITGNENVSIDDISLMVWLCSEDISREEILEIFTKELTGLL